MLYILKFSEEQQALNELTVDRHDTLILYSKGQTGNLRAFNMNHRPPIPAIMLCLSLCFIVIMCTYPFAISVAGDLELKITAKSSIGQDILREKLRFSRKHC